eukprot:514017-Pyramimonas_sp.AAC.1
MIEHSKTRYFKHEHAHVACLKSVVVTAVRSLSSSRTGCCQNHIVNMTSPLKKCPSYNKSRNLHKTVHGASC